MLNPCTDEFVDHLRKILPPATFRVVEPRYGQEPRGLWTGVVGAVLAPADTAEVAAVIKAAGAACVPVIPYGGGTGLVSGQVAGNIPAPLILSLERMSAIRQVDSLGNTLVAEAGAVLKAVQEAADTEGRFFPLSLGSEGTARIGGLLSTNAGGINVLRYGNARNLVLGIEAVLPDGSIHNGLKSLRKDNTGYDLRHLLIGAEGTLGVITAASLSLHPRPAGEGTAVMAVTSPAAALELLALAQAQTGGSVTGFELIHAMGIEFLRETGLSHRLPLEAAPEWSVLIEVGLPQGLSPEARLEALFEAGLEAGLVTDGTIAQNLSQRRTMWALRESIPEANRRIGAIRSHDISLPIARIPEFIAKAAEAMAAVGDFRINCFGHLGDGNLHYNIFPSKGNMRADYADQAPVVTRALHDLADSMGGSFSAEHGIGRAKVGELERYGDPAKLSAMRAIKGALDPAGIMNPGAVLRLSVSE